jgi:hypothetical protein
MNQSIGRPWAARLYAWLIALAALVIVVQALLFGGFYSQGGNWMEGHLYLGRISTFVVVAILTPLGFLARFPREIRVGPLTVALAVLWLVQTSLGDAMDFARWFVVIHIPLAFILFGLALWLAGKAHQAVGHG